MYLKLLIFYRLIINCYLNSVILQNLFKIISITYPSNENLSNTIEETGLYKKIKIEIKEVPFTKGIALGTFKELEGIAYNFIANSYDSDIFTFTLVGGKIFPTQTRTNIYPSFLSGTEIFIIKKIIS